MKKRSPSAAQLRDIPVNWTREQKIEALLPLAKRLSRRFPIVRNRVSLDYEDLYAVAARAVVEAVDHFDCTRKVTLPQFAVNKINWALMDLFRESEHSSRSMQERGEFVQWVHFSSNENDSTVEAVLADTLVDDTADVQAAVMYRVERELLREYIARLPDERDRKIMHLNVYEGKTNAQIAQVHNISSTRVNQLIARSIERMKIMYQNEAQSASLAA